MRNRPATALSLVAMLAVTPVMAAPFVATIGGAQLDAFEAVVPLPSGGALGVGWTRSTPGGSEDGWIVEMDAGGQVLRQVTLGGGGFDLLRDAIVLPGGDVIVVGRMLSPGLGATGGWIVRLAPDLTVRWQVVASPSTDLSSIVALPDGTFLVGGQARPPATSSLLAWWAKIDTTGVLECDLALDSGFDGLIKAMSPAAGGDVVAALCHPCGSADSPDVLVARIAASTGGALTWQVQYGDAGWDWPEAVLVTPAGDVAVAGYALGASASGGVVVLLDGAGSMLWQELVAPTGLLVEPEALAISANGPILFGGTSSASGLNGPIVVALETSTGAVAWSRLHGTAYSGGLQDNHGLAIAADGTLWSLSDRVTAAGAESDAYVVHGDAAGVVDVACPSEVSPVIRLTPTTFVPSTLAHPTRLLRGATITTNASIRAASLARTEICVGTVPTPPLEVSPPGSPQPLLLTSHTELQWEDAAASGSDTFNLYRAVVSRLPSGERGTCLASDLAGPAAIDTDLPGVGAAFFYLVTGRNAAGEGPMGRDSLGAARRNATPCP